MVRRRRCTRREREGLLCVADQSRIRRHTRHHLRVHGVLRPNLEGASGLQAARRIEPGSTEDRVLEFL